MVGPKLDDLSLNPEGVRQQIRRGGGGMPPFEGQLSASQIDSLVQYLTGSTQ
jgi:mono/diheme cytochrome c family protein